MVALTTKELRFRVRRRFTGRATPSGFPSHVVLDEVPVDQTETVAEKWGVDATRPAYEGQTPEAQQAWAERLARPAGVRRIDVVAMGLWRSTNHLVHGIELKVSRSDWLKELRQPEKAAAAVRCVDLWWIAVGDRTIVKDGELPDGWGLLVPSGRGLRTLVEPQRNPEPVRNPSWWASMVVAAATQHGICRGIARIDGYWDGVQAGRAQRW